MNVIGLMSGTSCDGVDAALVRIRGQGYALRAKMVAFQPLPFPVSLHLCAAQASASLPLHRQSRRRQQRELSPKGGALAAVRAFDTGSSNMVPVGLVQRLTKGRRAMDDDGSLAAKGRVDPRRLNKLMAHPLLKRRPPKSTGREELLEQIPAKLLNAKRSRHLTPSNLLATCAMWTAQTVSGARRWLHGDVDEVIGGGVRNRTLMSDLAFVFTPAPVKTFDEPGWNSKALEAVAFALLAYQTIAGERTNIRTVTGAADPALLVAIVPGNPRRVTDICRRRGRIPLR